MYNTPGKGKIYSLLMRSIKYEQCVVYDFKIVKLY